MLLFVGIASPSAAAPNLIVNGSFEENSGTMGSFGYGGGRTYLEGWQVTQANIDLVGPYWVASDGQYSVDLTGNGSEHAKIEQSFSTIPTREYHVLFDMAGNALLGGPPQTLRIGASGSFSLFSFDVAGKSQTNMGWTEKSWSFVANSTSTTLSFESLVTSFYHGPALDNVRVTLVPEPSSLCLAGMGMLCALVYARRLLWVRR